MSNSTFALTYAQQFNSTYEEERYKRKSENEAFGIAAADAFLNSLIEYGGGDTASGVEGLFQGEKKGKWLKNQLDTVKEEITEEISQDIEKSSVENMAGVISRGQPEHEIFSAGNKDAVVSVAGMLDTAVDTAITTMVMGAEHTGIEAVQNAANTFQGINAERKISAAVRRVENGNGSEKDQKIFNSLQKIIKDGADKKAEEDQHDAFQNAVTPENGTEQAEAQEAAQEEQAVKTQETPENETGARVTKSETVEPDGPRAKMDAEGDALLRRQAEIAVDNQRGETEREQEDKEAQKNMSAENQRTSSGTVETESAPEGITQTPHADSLWFTSETQSVSLPSENSVAQQEKEVKENDLTNASAEQNAQSAEQGEQSAEQGEQSAERQAEAITSLSPQETQKRTAALGQELNVRADGEGSRGTPGVTLVSAARTLSDEQKAEIRVLDGYAKEKGIAIEFYDALGGGQANGEYSGGNTVRIATDAQNPFITVAGHEVYHLIKKNSERAAQIERLFDAYAENTEGYSLEERISQKISEYGKNGVKLSPEEAKEELIADSLFDVVGTEDAARTLYGTDKSLFYTLKEWVEKTIASIRRMLSRYAAGSPEARMLSRDEDQLTFMKAAFDAALEDAVKSANMARETWNIRDKSEAAKKFTEAAKGATTDARKGAALRAFASDILKATGNEDTEENASKLIDAARAFVAGKEKSIPLAVKNAGLTPWFGDDAGMNSAFGKLGKSAAQMEKDGVKWEVSEDKKKNMTDEVKKIYDKVKIDYPGYDEAWYLQHVENTIAMRQQMKTADKENPREITSTTYERAQKRLTKDVQNFVGKWSAKEEIKQARYDYSKPFAEQIEDWIAGKIPQGDTLVIGKTPELYQQVGLSALPMTIDQTHVDYAVNGTKNKDHFMGAEMLKKLPEMLEKPVAIIESVTRPEDSVVVIVQGMVNGHQMMAAVEISGTGYLNREEFDVNVISSTQGRNNTVSKLLDDAIKKESAGYIGVYYWDKEEAHTLYSHAGVQFPGSSVEDGLNHSIFDAGSPVNKKFVEQTETRQFKRWFGKSKIVNEDGKPLIVYHGSDGEFNAFDMSKGRANMDIQGAFFSPWEIDARGYGNNVRAFYLSIKNPADEQTGYKALRMFQGQNNAGIKAREWLIAHGYDGVNNGDEEYIAFYPAQIKSATDNRGTFDGNNPDIRYSLKSPAPTADDLLSEGAYVKYSEKQGRTAEEAQEEYETFYAPAIGTNMDAAQAWSVLSRMYEQSGKNGAWKGRVSEVARALIEKTQGTGLTVRQVENRVRRAFAYMDEQGLDGLRAAITEMSACARDLISRGQDTRDETYEDVTKYLRETRFFLSEGQKGEVENVYGSVAAYARQGFGTIRLATRRNEGTKRGQSGSLTSLESVWGELNGIAPSVFKEDVSEGDMPLVLINYILNKRGQEAPMEKEYMEFADDAALSAVTSYFDLSSEAQKEKLARVKADADEKIREAREKREEWQTRSNERLEKAVKAAREKYQASLTGYRERAAAARTRQGIRKVGAEIRRAIAAPDKNQFMPLDYMRPMMEVAEALTSADASVTDKKLAAWAAAYSQMRDDPDYFISHNAFDADMAARIGEVRELCAKKTVNQMSADEALFVYETLRGAQTAVSNARKLLGRTRRVNAYEEATSAIKEVEAAKGIDMHSTRDKFTNGWITCMEDGVRALRRFGGWARDGALERAGRELADGQRKQQKIEMEGSAVFSPLLKGDDAKEAKELSKAFGKFAGKKAEWADTGVKVPTIKNGVMTEKSLRISPAMRASLYLHAQNEQNMKHVEEGGVTVPDERLYKAGRKSEAYNQGETVRLSKAQVKQIIAGMTDYEKAWCNAWLALEKTLSAHINETSMTLNGFKKAIVEHYFPLRSDRNFLKTDFEAVVRDGSIEGMGMLKSRKGGANPILLEELSSVAERQIENTAKYAGLAIPVRNFTMVYNGTMQDYAGSVKNSIAKKWGDTGKSFVENLLADVQGARKRETNAFDRARGNFAQATLSLNVSTALKQISGAYTIAPVTGWKALNKAMATVKMADVKEIGKWTATNWARGESRGKTEIGGAGRNYTLFDAAPKLDWLNKMDEWTMRKIWTACGYAVDTQQGAPQKGTDAYFERVAELFDRCVEATQPTSATMQRADIARNPNGIVKSLTMFMGQGLQNFNTVYDALGDMRARAADLKKLDSAENKQAYAEAKKTFARAASSQIASAAITAVCGLVARMLLQRVDPYRDEKEELTAGSVAGMMANDFLENLAGNVIGGQEIYALFESILSGKQPYDIDAAGVDTLNTLYQTTYKVGQAIASIGDTELTDAEKFNKVRLALWNFGKEASKAYGIPATNVENLYNAALAHYRDFESGEALTFNASRKNMTTAAGASYMAQALNTGDKAEYTRLFNRLRAQGKTDSQIMSALKKWYRDNDTRVRGAAEALLDGDLSAYRENVSGLISLGFAKSTVTEMATAKRDAMASKGAEEAETSDKVYTFEEAISAGTKGKKDSIYTGAMLNDLIEQGDTKAARQVMKELLKTNTASAVKASITARFKPLVQAAREARDTRELARLKKALYAMGISDSTIRGWTTQKKSGFGSGFGS